MCYLVLGHLAKLKIENAANRLVYMTKEISMQED